MTRNARGSSSTVVDSLDGGPGNDKLVGGSGDDRLNGDPGDDARFEASVAPPAGAPAGPLIWGAGNNDLSLDLAPGETLEVRYQTQVVLPVDETMPITNVVWVDWTSRQDDDVYQRTGNGCPAITPPDDYCYGPASADGTPYPVGSPVPLIKANSQPTATIGEEFSYRITIPGAPYPLPMYDVRIVDDLAASAADKKIRFWSVG